MNAIKSSFSFSFIVKCVCVCAQIKHTTRAVGAAETREGRQDKKKISSTEMEMSVVIERVWFRCGYGQWITIKMWPNAKPATMSSGGTFTL